MTESRLGDGDTHVDIDPRVRGLLLRDNRTETAWLVRVRHMLDVDVGSHWPKRWKSKKGDGTYKGVAPDPQFANLFKKSAQNTKSWLHLSQRSQKVAKEATTAPKTTRSATRGGLRGLAKSDELKCGNGDDQAQTGQRVQAHRWTLGDLEAKAGKIEERRKVACPEITHAPICVVPPDL